MLELSVVEFSVERGIVDVFGCWQQVIKRKIELGFLEGASRFYFAKCKKWVLFEGSILFGEERTVSV